MTMKFLCIVKKITEQIMCSQEKGFKLNRFIGKHITHERKLQYEGMKQKGIQTNEWHTEA